MTITMGVIANKRAKSGRLACDTDAGGEHEREAFSIVYSFFISIWSIAAHIVTCLHIGPIRKYGYYSYLPSQTYRGELAS